MSLADFSFARAWCLLALLPLGILVWQLWRKHGRDAGIWQHAVDAHLLPHLLEDAADRNTRGWFVLLGLGLLMAVFALAGPSLSVQPETLLRRDAARVLVIDLSSQMESESMDRVRWKLLEVLRAQPDTRTALIIYAGEPYLVAPLTTDVETIARFVPELAPAVVPVMGNRPALAMHMAADVLERSGASRRDILWLTAAKSDAILPTVPAMIRLSILHVASESNPQLDAMAHDSGGLYVRLSRDNSDVAQLLAVDKADNAWLSGNRHRTGQLQDYGYWLLLPLLLIAALAFRRGVLCLPLAVLVATALVQPQPAMAQDFSIKPELAEAQAWWLPESGTLHTIAEYFAGPRWRAVSHYRAANFAEAARLLEREQDAESLYNRGNALAMQGLYAEALIQYERSLAVRMDDDTHHNRDLMRHLLKPRNQSQKGGVPPPAANSQNTEQEAARVAGQWLRGVADDPAKLLRRKLLLEQQRRESEKARRAG